MERIRGLSRRAFLILAPAALFWTGCPTTPGGHVDSTPMQVAMDPYSSDQLLSVGVEMFDPGDLDGERLEKQHTSRAIRESEARFMPYHLKNTLERSGFWGEVRVVPENAGGMDVTVQATVLESNGETLALDVRVVDARNMVWIDRVYRHRATKEDYEDIQVGERGPFQDLYNAIANDMAAVRRRMDPLMVKRLRRATELLFAAGLVPEAFGDYVRTDPEGRAEVVRLPAEDDPMWRRVETIARRNEVFHDALNATYEPFYQQLWKPYAEWRRYNLVEQISLRETRNQGIKQAAAGIAMIAAAILLEVNDVENSSTIRDVLVLGGSQVVINGVNISQRADIHRETLGELADSFGSEAGSVTVELEGRTVELTGTVRQQMAQWRELLRRLYREETGLPVDEDP